MFSSLLLLLLIATNLLLIASLTAYDFDVTDSNNNIVNLSKYSQSKVLIIVNTAINCGYTYTNFRDLNYLYRTFHDLGLDIIGFPTTQFGLQEPDNNAEIQLFSNNYGVLFPIYGLVSTAYLTFIILKCYHYCYGYVYYYGYCYGYCCKYCYLHLL